MVLVIDSMLLANDQLRYCHPYPQILEVGVSNVIGLSNAELHSQAPVAQWKRHITQDDF